VRTSNPIVWKICNFSDMNYKAKELKSASFVIERNLECMPFSRNKLCSQSGVKLELVVMVLKFTILTIP
jgi:hypothetical protein